MQVFFLILFLYKTLVNFTKIFIVFFLSNLTSQNIASVFFPEVWFTQVYAEFCAESHSIFLCAMQVFFLILFVYKILVNFTKIFIVIF